jgi:ubiquinone/menaquinone biosynthesis C-methylase UbiE
MKKQSQNHYSYSVYREEEFAHRYEMDRFGGLFGEYVKRLECEYYENALPSHPRVLDVGSGSGKLAVHLARSRWVVAADASLQMLLVAREQAAVHGVSPQLVVCDAHNLCFKNDAFDAVVSSRVLMHVSNWRAVVGELCRVSSHSAVIDFPSSVSFTLFERIARRVLKWFRPNVQTYRGFFPATVKTEYKRYDFHVRSQQKMFFFPFYLYRMVNSPALASRLESVCRGCGLTALFGSPVMMRVDQVRWFDYE